MSHIFRVLVLVATLLGGFAGGCRTFNKSVTEAMLKEGRVEHWHASYGNHSQYTLDNKTMKDLELEELPTAGDTAAHYQRGLAEQARCIADKTAELIAHVQESTGMTILTKSPVYLLRFDQAPENFNIRLEAEPNEFPLLLFVRAGDESCESILAQNPLYPGPFVHELVETSLMTGRRDGVVLPDPSWGPVIHINNYTRWFREGLADYAGYVACKALLQGIPDSQRPEYRRMLMRADPFSSLSWVGGKLFSWRQSSPTSYDAAYYSAALGLFLLIEDVYGQEAIRKIMGEIAKREAVDGRDLVTITNQALGADVKRLAEEFDFPEIGAKMERLTPALVLNSGLKVQEGLFVRKIDKDSPAARAGLQERDVITAVGATWMTHGMDFELAVFKAREQPSVSLSIERREVGTMTLDLPLQKPESTAPRS